MDVRLPDGTVVKGVPEGMGRRELTEKLLANGMHKSFGVDPSDPNAIYKAMSTRENVDPTKDMGHLDRFNAGMGKAFVDIASGASQLVGGGPSSEEVRNRRELDSPLMSTGGGIAGNIAGNVAALAPAAFIPGAGSVAGAGAIGATIGALQPTENTKERLVNMGKGGALGASVQFAGGPAAQYLGQRQAVRESEVAAAKSRNAVRDETLRESQKAGYVVPPSSVNDSWLNRRLESIAGKTAVGQEASVRNNQVSDSLGRRAAGMGPDEALSESALLAARNRAAAPYGEAGALDPKALDAWKTANAEAKLQWNYYQRTGTPQAYKDYLAEKLKSDGALNQLDQAAQQAGRPDLVQALKNARVQVAKVHNVDDAVNSATGSLDASVLGRSLANGQKLTGELETIAKFQQAFPQYAREASRIGTPGVSATEAAGSAALGMGGAAVAGNPAGLLAGGLPLLREPARNLLFSSAYQRLMGNPTYRAPLFTGGGELLPMQEPSTAALVRALSLPNAANQ